MEYVKVAQRKERKIFANPKDRGFITFSMRGDLYAIIAFLANYLSCDMMAAFRFILEYHGLLGKSSIYNPLGKWSKRDFEKFRKELRLYKKEYEAFANKEELEIKRKILNDLIAEISLLETTNTTINDLHTYLKALFIETTLEKQNNDETI